MTGFLIGRRRRELGLALRDVHDRCGVSIGFLSEVEHGRKDVTVEMLRRIAAALDTPPSCLIDQQAPDAACYHVNAVFWDPYARVVRCHRCGVEFVPRTDARTETDA